MKKNIELYTTCDRDLDEHNAKALIIMWNAAIEAAIDVCEKGDYDYRKLRKLKK